MRKRHFSTYIFVGLTIFIATGCGIFSLHPLYHYSDLRMHDDLIGTWENKGEEEVFVVIDTIGDQKYEFILVDAGDTVMFEMGLLKLDDQYYVDLYPHEDCSFMGDDDCESLELMFKNYIPVHTFMKFDFNAQELVLTEFDNERLIELFQKDRIRLEHEMIGQDEDYVVITASTSNLQKFISRYSNDEEAFLDPETYTKVN